MAGLFGTGGRLLSSFPQNQKEEKKMSIISVPEADQREPLLPPSSADNQLTATSPSTVQQPPPLPKSQRLVSLDVFRGLTVALMILVDDAGGAFPSINHSPWFGVTLADFVMPFFLFGVGVSIGLVFKRVPNKVEATKKVVLRTVKLFVLGVLLQGGYFHGRHDLTYGVDVGKMRWLGVLQRISIGYLFASLSEIWLVDNSVVTSVMTFVKKYYVQWMVAFVICAIYMCLLYGLFVPDWRYELQTANPLGNGSYSQMVHCGVRGSLDPPCNAVGLVDRVFLGLEHLYQHPVYTRTEQCSVNSPDYGPLPPNAPNWCRAPFDPEGILSSLMAAITCFIGLHFGHMLLHVKDNMQRLVFWTVTSSVLLITGYVLVLLGIPLSKPLYTLSYTFVTAGASGLTLAFIFYMVDIKQFRKPGLVMQWMGMNALIVYSLAACEIFPAALQGFYLFSPENNLIDCTEWALQKLLHSEQWGTLAFVMLEIFFWGLFSGFLHFKGIYVKL